LTCSQTLAPWSSAPRAAESHRLERWKDEVQGPPSVAHDHVHALAAHVLAAKVPLISNSSLSNWFWTCPSARLLELIKSQLGPQVRHRGRIDALVKRLSNSPPGLFRGPRRRWPSRRDRPEPLELGPACSVQPAGRFGLAPSGLAPAGFSEQDATRLGAHPKAPSALQLTGASGPERRRTVLQRLQRYHAFKDWFRGLVQGRSLRPPKSLAFSSEFPQGRRRHAGPFAKTAFPGTCHEGRTTIPARRGRPTSGPSNKAQTRGNFGFSRASFRLWPFSAGNFGSARGLFLGSVHRRVQLQEGLSRGGACRLWTRPRAAQKCAFENQKDRGQDGPRASRRGQKPNARKTCPMASKGKGTVEDSVAPQESRTAQKPATGQMTTKTRRPTVATTSVCDSCGARDRGPRITVPSWMDASPRFDRGHV